MIAMALASLWPAPVSLALEGRDEQRMNVIPKRSANSTRNCQIPIGPCRFAPVLTQRQLVTVVGTGRLPNIVVPLPQVVRGDLVAKSIS